MFEGNLKIKRQSNKIIGDKNYFEIIIS